MSEAPLPPSSPKKEKKSLTEIFNHFGADAVKRFPHLKGKLLILDMNQHEAHGQNTIDTEKTGLTKETATDYLSNHEVTQEMEEDKEMSSLAWRDPERHVNIIFNNESIPESEFKDVKKETEEHLLFVLDHELAHCAIKDGFSFAESERDYKILLSESVADAYALIRHYQRYGVDNDSHDKYISPAARADNFMLYGDSTHFTSFVLEAIVKRKHLIDFDKLDDKQTADLARRFALEFMPPQRAVEDIGMEFRSVRIAFSKNMSGGVKALIEKTLDPNIDYYAFKIGSLWLKGYLENRTFSDGSPIRLSKKYLDDAAKRLQERERKFEKENILFNMPIVPPKAPANNFTAPRMQA